MTTRYICWSGIDEAGAALTGEPPDIECLCEVDSDSECSVLAGGWPWEKCQHLEIKEREQADAS